MHRKYQGRCTTKPGSWQVRKRKAESSKCWNTTGFKTNHLEPKTLSSQTMSPREWLQPVSICTWIVIKNSPIGLSLGLKDLIYAGSYHTIWCIESTVELQDYPEQVWLTECKHSRGWCPWVLVLKWFLSRLASKNTTISFKENIIYYSKPQHKQNMFAKKAPIILKLNTYLILLSSHKDNPCLWLQRADFKIVCLLHHKFCLLQTLKLSLENLNHTFSRVSFFFTPSDSYWWSV